MSLSYSNALLRVIVAKICQDVGWHTAHVSALNVLSDLLKLYIKQISVAAVNFANHAGRSQPTIDDVAVAFNYLSIDISQLQNYILNVDSSPLDIKVPFFPLPCKQNRVLDRTDPDEERDEYYYEWLQSLKCKAIDLNPNGECTIEEVTSENVEEKKDQPETRENEAETKIEIAEGENLDAEKAKEDEESKKKLVFKFSLGKSTDEPLPATDGAEADQSKANLTSTELITSQLMTSRAYLKFLKSSLFTSPDDPNLTSTLRKPDSQRLTSNYVSRENSPEPDPLNNSNSMGIIAPIDPLASVDIGFKKKKKDLAKSRRKKNKENDFDDLDESFGSPIKASIKVKEIGSKKKGEGTGRKVNRKKPKDGSKLNIKVTDFGFTGEEKIDNLLEIKESSFENPDESMPKKRKYARKGEKTARKKKNDPDLSDKNLLLSPSSEAFKESFGDEYTAKVFVPESHDDHNRGDDKKISESINSSDEESGFEFNESSRSGTKKLGRPSTKRSKGVNSKKQVKSAEVVESSDDSSSGPEVDSNSNLAAKLAELDALTPLSQPSSRKRHRSTSSISSLSSDTSSKSISIRSASNDFDLDSKSERISKTSSPLDLSFKDSTKSKDGEHRKEKHKKSKKKDKHRSEKSHKKHKKLKEREKEKSKEFKPKLSIKLGENPISQSEVPFSQPFDECMDVDANLEPPIKEEFKFKMDDSLLSKKKSSKKSKKSGDSSNELVFVKDNSKSKELKKIVKASILFENNESFDKLVKSGKHKIKDLKLDKDLLAADKKPVAKLKKNPFEESLLKVSGEKKKEKTKDESKKKNESKSCTVVRETITVDEKVEDKLWICPNCNRPDDGTMMIGCDKCDDWYHYSCVGIVVEPNEDEPWFCPKCILKETKKSQKKMQSTKISLGKSRVDSPNSVTITPIPLPMHSMESMHDISLLPVKAALGKQNVTITPTVAGSSGVFKTGKARGRPRKDSTQSSSKHSLTITPIGPGYSQYDLPPESDYMLNPYYEDNLPSTSAVGYSLPGNKKKKELCPKCNKWMDNAPMINCDKCEQWYHWHCVGINNAPSPDSTWLCSKCQRKRGWDEMGGDSDISDEMEMRSLTDTKFLAATGGLKSKQPMAVPPVVSQQTWRCGICHIESTDEDNISWIACDECDKWYHFKCAGVTCAPNENESWFCRTCIEKQQSIESKIAKIKRI